MSTEHPRQEVNVSSDFLLAQEGTGSQSVDDILNETDVLIEDINRQIDGYSETPETAIGGLTIAGVVIGGALLFLGKKFAEGAASRAGEDAYDRIAKRKARK